MGTQLSKRPETPMLELLEDILMLMPMVSFKRLNTLLMVQDSVLLTLVSLSSTLTSPVYTGVAPTFNPEPLVAPVYTGVAPASVVDTPEVAEAKAAHAAALVAATAAAADRKKREADPAILGGATTVLSAPTPLIHTAPVLHHAAYAGLGYAGLGYAGLGHAGLGYAGLGYAGLGHAGLGYAGLGHAGLPYYG